MKTGSSTKAPTSTSSPSDRLTAEMLIARAKTAFETGELLEGTSTIQALREFLKGTPS